LKSSPDERYGRGGGSWTPCRRGTRNASSATVEHNSRVTRTHRTQSEDKENLKEWRSTDWWLWQSFWN
jgi:hypothetical protein